MIFGTKDKFAIEAMSEPTLKAPSSVWGRMRIWCEGESIGNFSEEFCGLYYASECFKYLADKLPTLWSQEFVGLDEIGIWNHLDRLLYGYEGDDEIEDDRTLEQCEKDWREWGKFNFLTNWGEQFDNGGKSFILCKPDGTVCVLNRSLPSERGILLQAPLEMVIIAINEYLEWFESEELRLNS